MVSRRTLIHPHILFIPHSDVPHLRGYPSLEPRVSSLLLFLFTPSFPFCEFIYLTSPPPFSLQHQFSPLRVPNLSFLFSPRSLHFIVRFWILNLSPSISPLLSLELYISVHGRLIFSEDISVIAFLQQFHSIFSIHVSSFPFFCTFCFQYTSSSSRFTRIDLFPRY